MAVHAYVLIQTEVGKAALGCPYGGFPRRSDRRGRGHRTL